MKDDAPLRGGGPVGAARPPGSTQQDKQPATKRRGPSRAGIEDLWWKAYRDVTVDDEDSGLQEKVAEYFESLLHSTASTPLGLLRAKLDQARASLLPTPVVLHEALQDMARRYDGPDCEGEWCTSCDEYDTPTPISACRCPGGDSLPTEAWGSEERADVRGGVA